MYRIHNSKCSPCKLNVTRSINLISERVPFSNFSQGNNIVDLDAIIYEPTTDIVHNYHSCSLSINCYNNPVWPILMGMPVFLSVLLITVSLLYCIHRI